MPREIVLIVTRNNYISRMWTWAANYGLLLFLAGVAFLYNYTGLILPMRSYLSAAQFARAMYIAYSVGIFSVMLSFLLRITARPGRLARMADLETFHADDNLPTGMTEIEHRAIYMIDMLLAAETKAWYAATVPGLIGIAVYVFGGTSLTLAVYLAVSMVTLMIERPSLDMADEMVEDFIRKRSVPFA